MLIKPIQPTDNVALASVIRAIFVEYDAPRVGTVYADPSLDSLYELFDEDKSMLWVAEDNGIVVGCCGIYPTEGLPEGCAELVKFYVAAHARGKGIGKDLIEKSIASAIDFGYTSLYIESLPHFDTAVRLYEKLGFETLTHPLGESVHTSCTIWMLKQLA